MRASNSTLTHSLPLSLFPSSTPPSPSAPPSRPRDPPHTYPMQVSALEPPPLVMVVPRVQTSKTQQRRPRPGCVRVCVYVCVWRCEFKREMKESNCFTHTHTYIYTPSPVLPHSTDRAIPPCSGGKPIYPTARK